jgi:hypothetical protein
VRPDRLPSDDVCREALSASALLARVARIDADPSGGEDDDVLDKDPLLASQ